MESLVVNLGHEGDVVDLGPESHVVLLLSLVQILEPSRGKKQLQDHPLSRIKPLYKTKVLGWLTYNSRVLEKKLIHFKL